MELDVFFGELTPARAVVYARLPREAGVDLTLSGTVRGPRCLHAQTLPANFSLVDLGPGPTVLARAIVTDPTHWTSELPAIYDVMVRVQRGAELLATERREIGLRALGTRGTQLALGGKNWVLRGVLKSSTNAKLPREWHAAGAALVCDGDEDEALAEAGQWGAVSVVRVSAGGEEAVRRIRMLARFPGVAVVLIQGELPRGFRKAAVAPNVLLAAALRSPTSRPTWAELLLVEARDADRFAEIAKQAKLPVVAVRRLDAPLDINRTRAACDELQRDLAPLGQFAGYVV